MEISERVFLTSLVSFISFSPKKVNNTWWTRKISLDRRVQLIMYLLFIMSIETDEPLTPCTRDHPFHSLKKSRCSHEKVYIPGLTGKRTVLNSERLNWRWVNRWNFGRKKTSTILVRSLPLFKLYLVYTFELETGRTNKSRMTSWVVWDPFLSKQTRIIEEKRRFGWCNRLSHNL